MKKAILLGALGAVATAAGLAIQFRFNEFMLDRAFERAQGEDIPKCAPESAFSFRVLKGEGLVCYPLDKENELYGWVVVSR